MIDKNVNRSRIIGLRLSPDEYQKLEKKWKQTTCRKLSDYVRRSLFDKEIVTVYRDKSLDDFMAEMIRLREELSAIGNNWNQAVKRLNSIRNTPDIIRWAMAYELEKRMLTNKVEEIKNQIRKIAEKWLQ